jgi:hypothetical protein
LRCLRDAAGVGDGLGEVPGPALCGVLRPIFAHTKPDMRIDGSSRARLRGALVICAGDG